MADTWTKIATGSTTADGQTITFSSIPATYTDLFAISNMRTATGSAVRIYMKFNNSTSGFSVKRGFWYPTGSYGSDVISDSGQVGWAEADSGYPSGQIIHIGQYSNTSYIKKYTSWTLDHSASTTGIGGFIWGQWSSTSAINQLDFYPESGSLKSGCSVTLYGISAGGSGSVSTS